ncbi:MAG: hypothetical protein MI702_13920 [Chlorobiales bacterium]|nr:hypothetical protein [Chlorobiales bacterium]
MTKEDAAESGNESVDERIPDEQNEKMVAMPLHKFKERLERVKRKVIKQYGGLTPEDVKSLHENMEQFELEKKQWQEAEFEHQAQKTELEKALAKTENLRKIETIRSVLTRCYLDNGGLPSALHDALNVMEIQNRDFELNSQGRVLFRNSDRKESSAEDFVKDFLNIRPHFRRASYSNGSGMPSAGSSGSAGIKRFIDTDIQSREGRLEAARKIVRE